MTPNDFIKKWRLGGDERRDWHSFFDDVCRLVRHETPREAEMASRTLTDLYNENPPWLQDDHEALNQAVAAAYGWTWPMSDEDIIKNLFDMNAVRTK